MNNIKKNDLLKYVSDESLCLSIANNLNFVDNYLDKVPSMFNNNIDQELAYKQLFIISYSILESLWKSISYTIFVHCNRNKKCKCEKCPYKKFKTKKLINNAKIFDVLIHLQSTRLLYFTPYEYKFARDLADTRNYIHLFKQIVIPNKQVPPFTKDHVESCLQMIYQTIEQVSLLDNYYFNTTRNCLKSLDNNCYKQTESMLLCEYFSVDSVSSYNACIKIFNDEQFSKDDTFHLKELKNLFNKNNNDLIEIKEKTLNEFVLRISNWLYFNRTRYKDNDSYNTKITSFFQQLKAYLPINLIDSISTELSRLQKMFNEANE